MGETPGQSKSKDIRGGGRMEQDKDSALVLAQQGVRVSGGQAGPWS